MIRRFQRRNRMEAFSQINVTPLLDLAWSLLIIFMITTPLLESSIPINLPETTKSKQANENNSKKIQLITIDSNGKYFWGNKSVSFSVLEDNIISLSSSNKETIVHIRADSSIKYQNVINVIDLMKKNGLSKIALDTRENS